MIAVRLAMTQLLFFLQFFKFKFKLFYILYIVRVGDDTVDRTDSDTLRLIEMSYAFRAAIRIYYIYGVILFDRFIGTLFSTCVASYTFIDY